MALIWAAGIAYAAVDFAGHTSGDADSNNVAATGITDDEGNPVSADDIKQTADALANM